MVVIHVSGSTASGKSFLGNLLTRIYTSDKLQVVDLDHIFLAAISRSEKATDKQEFISRYVLDHIAKLRGRAKNLLITGYSDITINGKIHYIELGADAKYFIDIGTQDLIGQYRYREGQHVLHTRHEAHSMSDDALRKQIIQDRKVYHGFRRLPQLQIVKEIILRLGK